MACKQLQARCALLEDQVDVAYKHMVAAYVLMINVMRDETAWMVPVLRRLTYEARVVAERADAARAAKTKKARETASSGTFFSHVVNELRRRDERRCGAGRRSDRRRLATRHVAGRREDAQATTGV